MPIYLLPQFTFQDSKTLFKNQIKTRAPPAIVELAEGLLQRINQKDRQAATDHIQNLMVAVGGLQQTIEMGLKSFCRETCLELARLHLGSLDPLSAAKVLEPCWKPSSPVFASSGQVLFTEIAVLKMHITTLQSVHQKILPL